MPNLLVTSIGNCVIVFDGDSLTYGNGLSTAYPNQCMASLEGKYVWYNRGVPGLGWSSIISGASRNVDPYINPLKTNILVIYGGINDAYGSAESSITASQLYSYYQTYVTARRAAGWNKVIVTSMTAVDPNHPPPYGYNPNYENVRASLRIMLMADFAGGDALSDAGGDPIIGNVAYTENATYFTDGLHMTATGYGIFASIAKKVLLQLRIP